METHTLIIVVLGGIPILVQYGITLKTGITLKGMWFLIKEVGKLVLEQL